MKNQSSLKLIGIYVFWEFLAIKNKYFGYYGAKKCEYLLIGFFDGFRDQKQVKIESFWSISKIHVLLTRL